MDLPLSGNKCLRSLSSLDCGLDPSLIYWNRTISRLCASLIRVAKEALSGSPFRAFDP